MEILQVSQMQVLPGSADMIQQTTQRDPLLSSVMKQIKQGCPAVHEKKVELTIQDGSLMWGSRVLHPPKHQTQVLDELHDGYLGVAKALARSYVWWSGIDKAIEQGSKGCTGCQLTQSNPKIAPLYS